MAALKGGLRGAGSLGGYFAWVAPLPYWMWVFFCWHCGTLRWDQVAMAVAATGLSWGNARTRQLLVALMPLSAVALLYDAMRLVNNAGQTPSAVHVCDFRALEMRWFGVNVGGVRGTVHDFWRVHGSTGLDLLCAVPYGIFLYVVIGYAVLLLRRDFATQQRFAWGFLLLNLAGFATYHLYPVAPPWYFHTFGCSVDLHARPSAGPHLEHVDAMLGMSYFHSFYARASDVFGALPSLHVAYPLLMIVEGWRQHGMLGRSLLVTFYVWMCFAAVYLDHHWVLDIVLGSTYALITARIMAWIIPVSPVSATAKLPVRATK